MKNQNPCNKIKTAYQRLKAAYKELKDSHVEMIFRMAMMAEYRDDTTGTHLVRIADYSSVIAESLGLPSNEVEVIRYASPMHDIGKVMIPDSILKKKGKLTFTEMALMRRHTLAGAEIFANAKTPLMKACGTIALTHHENYNGSGYPRGLKGNKIPLYGRIVAVADVFDALTSKRSYKDKFSMKKTFDIITEESGTHFDPQVVNALIREKEKITRILEANEDIEEFIEEGAADREEWAIEEGEK